MDQWLGISSNSENYSWVEIHSYFKLITTSILSQVGVFMNFVRNMGSTECFTLPQKQHDRIEETIIIFPREWCVKSFSSLMTYAKKTFQWFFLMAWKQLVFGYIPKEPGIMIYHEWWLSDHVYGLSIKI